MSAVGFLDHNRHRAYPFLDGTTGRAVDGPASLANLPDSVVVDCGFRAGPQSGYDSAAHRVYLSSITRVSNLLTFVFQSDAPGLADSLLTFTRTIGQERYLTEFTDSEDSGYSESGSSSSSGLDPGGDCRSPLWDGYLVTGDLDTIETLLPGDGIVTATGDAATVEPTLTQSLTLARVTSLRLANAERSRAESPADCPEATWPFELRDIYVNPRCLGDEIIIKPGFNLQPRQSLSGNVLHLTPGVGLGAGEPCEEVRLLDAEAPPAGDSLLSGGPACNEILRSLNGEAGPNLTLRGGPGVTLTPTPASNKITVAIDMSGLSTCQISEVSEPG